MTDSLYAEARTHLFSVRDLIRFATTRFESAEVIFGHGTGNAYDEAVWLVTGALRLPGDLTDHFLDARLVPLEIDRVVSLIQKRAEERIPAAYLLNEAWLGDLKFYVDERVIVPRSFIAEILRDEVAPWIEDPDGVTRVLDLCTGSGCLAILAAHVFYNAEVDAVDLSDAALAVAELNVAQYGLADRVHLIQSDLYANVTDCYDLIISNPPYVDAPSMQALPAEYRHEPTLALGSGTDGLDHVRQILKGAIAHLNPGGILVVEIGHNRVAVEAAWPDLPLVWLETAAGDDYVFLVTREGLALEDRLG